MLHKKSEYRLQYNKLSDDLRRKIWQDNISLRKSRTLSNQATHHWEYQLRDETCECEVGNETDTDSGPVPPNRQKHKELCEQYKQHQSKTQVCPLIPGIKDAREAGVQTPEWTGDEPDRGVEPSSEEELLRHMSSLTLPEAKEGRSRPPSPVPPKTPSALSGPRTARSLSRPSRTTRKLVTETKQTHFMPFAWNEKTRKMGHKLTYNVCAPKKEVHESAIQASQRRKAEVEEFLAEEKAAKHHSRTPRERVSSNSSSLWMSEYQDQYCAIGSKNSSRLSRPLSAPPAPRAPVAWRHS